MATAATEGEEHARSAAARAAVTHLDPGMSIGLGSGRAVWRVIEMIGSRWTGAPPLRAVCASRRTEERARAAGIAPVELGSETRLDLAIDGTDEVDGRLRLIKGGGGALLREKLVITAAERFLVVAEAPKRVEHLGERHRLPVEVVRFAWQQTRRRVLSLLPAAELRTAPDGVPFITDEGHCLLDCPIPAGLDPDRLAHELKRITGVVEHGLFIGMADSALLGTSTGEVEVLDATPTPDD